MAMRKNIIKVLIIIVVILLPILAYTQASDNPMEATGSLLKFTKGDGAFERWFMEVFTKLDTQVETTTYAASLLGRAIGGIGALIYLSVLGWQMQAGERNWDVTPMIRPIIIGLILMHWPSFVQLIQVPLEKLSAPSEAIFADIEQEVEDVRLLKTHQQRKLMDFLYEQKAQDLAKVTMLESLEHETDKSWFSAAQDLIMAPIYEFRIRFEWQTQKLFADVIEFVALAILRVCVYLIFFIQKIWAYILIVLGPIAVGLSLIPGFEAAFGNWLSKFINVNLYTFIAYTIINIGQQLIVAGYKMEIDRYQELIDDKVNIELILAWISSSGLIYNQLFVTVAYVVTGIAVLMVPTIADQIVTAGGSGVFTKAKGVVKNAVRIAMVA